MNSNAYDFHVEYLAITKINDLEQAMRGIQLYKGYTQDQLIAMCKKDADFWVNGLKSEIPSIFKKYGTADIGTLKSARRNFQKALNKIPTDLQDPVFNLWRSCLQDVIEAIDDELQDKGMEQNPSDNLRNEIRKTLEMITNLERDRDEEIKKNPAQADLIKKIYRQAIDRIREQQ